jgi:hypothetical protein
VEIDWRDDVKDQKRAHGPPGIAQPVGIHEQLTIA